MARSFSRRKGLFTRENGSVGGFSRAKQKREASASSSRGGQCRGGPFLLSFLRLDRSKFQIRARNDREREDRKKVTCRADAVGTTPTTSSLQSRVQRV